MHFSTTLIALTAALGSVSAAPSAHAHLHARKHLENRNIEFKKAGRPHEEPIPSPEPVPTTTAVATPTQVKVRATLDQIMYAGNVGTADNWGCNMQIIDKAAVDKYDYTTKFASTGEKFSCSCFNKVGPKGLLDGFWFSAVDFTVADPGKDDVYMAFDTNSQGGCACGPGDKTPRTAIGQLAGVWLEFDWGSEPNGGNSGADASVLVAGAAGLPYPGMSVSANGKVCSWVKSDGTNEAAYMPGMEDLDGIGCKGYHKGHLDVLIGDKFNH
ncbi:Allergen Asp f 4 like protein [Verticillium longisporum]|nr:Allergen Asp f 4 like protein [Verticillium longisporum]